MSNYLDAGHTIQDLYDLLGGFSNETGYVASPHVERAMPPQQAMLQNLLSAGYDVGDLLTQYEPDALDHAHLAAFRPKRSTIHITNDLPIDKERAWSALEALNSHMAPFPVLYRMGNALVRIAQR